MLPPVSNNFPYEHGGTGLPNINEDQPDHQRRQLMETIHRYMVFNADPGNTHALEHAIPTGDHRSIALSPRRIPQAWAKQVKEEVHGMLAAGVMEPSTSPLMFPIVPVHKKDGKVRVCVDYRELSPRAYRPAKRGEGMQLPHMPVETAKCWWLLKIEPSLSLKPAQPPLKNGPKPLAKLYNSPKNSRAPTA